MTHEEKQHEEAKRERNWDSLARWNALQESLAFVDSQQPIPRNSKQSCLIRQREFDKRHAGKSE